MIPDGSLSASPHPGPFLYPDNLSPIVQRPEGIHAEADPTDWEAGGIDLNDPSQGLEMQRWKVWADGFLVYAQPDDGPAQLLIDLEPAHGAEGAPTEVSLAFDANMAWYLAYVCGGTAYWRWYDTTLPGYDTMTLTGGVSPRATLDDKRPLHDDDRDILLFYLRAGALYYRMQRERFADEHWLMDVPAGVIGLGRVGLTAVLRVQIELLEEDDLWVGTGEAGSSQTGLWRILEPLPWSLEHLNQNVQTIASTINALANEQWFTWAGDDVEPGWTPATEVSMEGGIAAPAIYVHDSEGRYQHVLLPWPAEPNRAGLVMALPNVPNATWSAVSTGTLWDTLRSLQYWMRLQGWALRTDLPEIGAQLGGTLGNAHGTLVLDPQYLAGLVGNLGDDAGLLAGTAA